MDNVCAKFTQTLGSNNSSDEQPIGYQVTALIITLYIVDKM